MSTFIVHGGKPLRGTYPVSGAKNAAPKLLIASLLTDQKCIFHNIPQFSDTARSADALLSLGAAIQRPTKHAVEIRVKKIKNDKIPMEAMSARQAVLFIGAMLARNGCVTIHPPKGDAIGRRPLNRHLDGIRTLGGTVKLMSGTLTLAMPVRPKSCRYRFEKNTHCGTENLLLASVFNQGRVILENAAQEPEVDNLIDTLNRMGARIRRIASRTIEIKGVKPYLRSAHATAIPDRLEGATAITASILTGGKVRVSHLSQKLVLPFTEFCARIGIRLQWKGNTLRILPFPTPLPPTDITTDCEPGFMTDWQPLATLILATLAQGRSMIHERIFETRWRYLEELKKMGIRYRKFQPRSFSPKDYNFNDEDYKKNEPHAAYVWGPTMLKAAALHSHDVRAGIDMLLAALVAKGTSVIHDPQNHIDRGYEDIVGKLTRLGADIKRI
ncbi:MAG: UDP-N-acetylglucosamine 1-carboxyvinyltransferase [Patescibacteria group bacterium]